MFCRILIHLFILAAMKKHFALLSVAFLMFANSVPAQKRLIEKFLSEKSDTTRNTSFIILPAAAYAQETGLEFGAISVTSFFTDKADTSTRTSAINAIVTFTTKKQSNFVIKPDIWSPGNRYHYSGVLRYKNFPFDFYGTGDETSEINKDRLKQKIFILSADVEKLITRRIYAGINAGYENYKFTDKESGGIYETEAFEDKEGGKLAYIGISAIFDSRNTNTYTTKGSFLKLNYSYAPAISNDAFKGSMMHADFRNFMTIAPKVVLGFNATYQTIQGSKLPFYLLPQLGNDQVMRGYYTGRYRDQNLVTAHGEIRYRFMNRFGVAAFAGTGSVFKNGDFAFRKFKPNYGAGVRYFMDPARGLTLRMDYAAGEKRAGEERQKGFYFALAEAF